MNKFINKFAILTVGLFTILTFNQMISAQFCGTMPPKSDGEKIWILTGINGATINSGRATLTLDFEKNRISGKGGCNGFGGNLEKTKAGIKISQIISTKMYCEDGSEIENKYLSTLEKVNKLKLADGKLQLLSGETVVLEFAPKN